MSVYSYVFGVLIALVSYVVYQKHTNVYTSIRTRPEKRYDYIIVGAGTAGCVLAARLSEDPRTKVLLVEAGDHMGYFTKVPLTPTAAQQGPNDWSVRTTPQRYSSFGLWDQTQLIPRGKGLGGSGQINFLLHGFGLPEDYNRWADKGFKGWTLNDLRPYFMKAFGTTRSEFDSRYCSLDGYCPSDKAPMKLQEIEAQNELLKVFKEASSLSKDKQTIFRKATATVKDGQRFGALDAYLKPTLRRKNLHVLLKTQAISIRFENTTASSLYILQNHRELDNIFVNKEIILCAGAIKTPQILMLSGIGPRSVVNRLRVKAIAENDHVGQNLHDHMNVPIYVSIKEPISITLAKVFSFSTAWDYFWKGTGLLSFPPVAGVEYQNSSAVMLFSMGTASERLLRDLSNYKPQVFRDTFPFHNQTSKEGFMFLATCTQPRSRGTVTLKDASIAIPPVVDPQYLKEHWDVKCIVKAMRRAERLVSTKPFQDIGAKIHWARPERCLSFWNYTRDDQYGETLRRKKKLKPSDITNRTPKGPTRKPKEPTIRTKSTPPRSPPDEYLECVIREVGVTGHHVAGTCAGGTVVDDELSLWVKYTRRAYGALRVQYNNGFRAMLGLPRWCSASTMFVEAHMQDFFAVMRARCASLLTRLRRSTNTLLSTLAGRWDSPMLLTWIRVKSISGVRVVDASVLPSPLSLYPNSVLIAMAEKAADIIKKSRHK